MKLRKFISFIIHELKLLRSIPKPMDCLQKEMSIEEAEEHIYKSWFGYNSQTARDREYFKELREKEWEVFVRKLKDDRELWFYNTPSIYWSHLMGRSGFVIIKKNGKKKKQIAIFNVAMN